MYIVKVLKRKDAASVMLAIILSLILLQPLQSIPSGWAAKLVIESGTDPLQTSYFPGQGDWKLVYAYPLLTLIIQLVLIEIGLRLFVYIRGGLVRRK